MPAQLHTAWHPSRRARPDTQLVPAEQIVVGDVLDLIGGPAMVVGLSDWAPYPVPLHGAVAQYRVASTEPGVGVSLFAGDRIRVKARAAAPAVGV